MIPTKQKGVNMMNLFLANTQAVTGGGLQQSILMIVLLVLFFYFILFRPEQKRRKKMQEIRNNMKKGDRVTAMGIVGTLETVKEKTVILKMFDGSKIEFLKMAISDVEAKQAAQIESTPAKKKTKKAKA